MARLSGYLTFFVVVLVVIVGGLILTAYLGALGLVLWIIAFALTAGWFIQSVRTRLRK